MFEDVSSATLRAIAAALRSGQLATPVSKIGLARVAPGCPAEAIDQIVSLSSDGFQPRHLALLLDQCVSSKEADLAGGAELVWTGPESVVAHSRDTAVVLSELFESAKQSVLISTFVVAQTAIVFATLAKRMAEVPDLRVQLFLHVDRGRRDTRYESEILREFAARFRTEWPGPVRPMLYYAPISLSLNPEERATWHAKVVVIDEATSFVTSANFTEWAQQRNVEAGVIVRNAHFARQLTQQFESLVRSKAVLEVPGFP